MSGTPRASDVAALRRSVERVMQVLAHYAGRQPAPQGRPARLTHHRSRDNAARQRAL
jgi:hypothetical protein